MLTDKGRGAELELLLTRIRQIAPEIQLVGLSAAVSDLNGFDKWINAIVIKDDHRPVPLREGAISPDGKFEFLEWQDINKVEGSENLPAYSGMDDYSRASDFVSSMLKDPNQQVIVFSNTVAKTQSLAMSIATESDCAAAKQAMELLAQLESSESIEALRVCLASGIAFHNSELTFEERQAVENGFRSREIRCIVCTSTLAMGVNLPASTAVIVKPTKWMRERGEWSEEPISIAEYKNMSGRSGRFGLVKDSFGRSIAICSRPIEKAAFLQRYPQGDVEPMTSVMANRELALMLLKLFASGLCETEDGAVRFLLKTFCATHHWRSDEQISKLKTDVKSSVKLLEIYQLTEHADSKVSASRLGKICASSGLEIETFGNLLSFVKSGNTSVVDIARLAAGGKETGADAGVGIRLSTNEYRNRVSAFLGYVRDCSNSFKSMITSLFVGKFDQPGQEPTYDEAKELKYQSVAMAFVQGESTRSIESRFGVRGGKIRAIGGMCSWLADTAAKIGWMLGKHEEAKKFEIVSERFLMGCSEEALFLSYVSHRLYREERELLIAAGFSSYQSIVNQDATQIAKTAKVIRAHIQGLQESIVDALGDVLDLERQQLARLSSKGVSGDGIEAIYVSKGAALERELEDLFSSPFCAPDIRRITHQKSGEADLKITFSDGSIGIAQVNAREPHLLVGVVKSGSVLQQSPELKPATFICIGRPDFDDDAKKKAELHVANGTNFKLIPISLISEVFVRFQEGRITAEEIEQLLRTETGYLGIDRLAN